MALINQTRNAEIKAALVAWSDAVIGSGKSVFSNQDHPKLARQFAVIEITDRGRDIGFDQKFENDNSGVLETHYVGQREMVVNVRVLGAVPTDLEDWPADTLQAMILTLQAESTMAAFRVVPLAYLSNTEVTKVDAQAGDRWEWGAESDLTFSYTSVLFDNGLADPPDDGGFIEQVQYEINDFGEQTVNADQGVFSIDFSSDFL